MTTKNEPLTLPFGTGVLGFDYPMDVETLLPNSQAPASSEPEVVHRALKNPIGSPPLGELARGRKSAIILISCRTRRTGSQVYVPAMLDELNAAGIPDEDILVYTATGTHDNFRQQDAELLVGSVSKRVRIVGHDCRTPEKLVEVGTTSRGTHVKLSKAYLDADLKIATGRVTYHYFAGFTSGRKAVLPGACAFETIAHNHGFTIEKRDGAYRLNEECRNGNLATNPIHLDMVEAAKLAPPDFTFCTVGNCRNEITHAFAGDMERAHERAVEIVRELDAPSASRQVDLLFLSAGGEPYDVNTIQAVKAVLNNYHIVRQGGSIIFAAECPEGSPPWLIETCAMNEGQLQEAIAGKRARKPHNALRLRRVTNQCNVIMITELPESDVRAMGFHKAANAAEALKMAEKLSGPAKTAATIGFGNITVARLNC